MACLSWHKHYIPQADIADNEINIPMSGSSYLTWKKQLRGKKIGAGIQLLGLAELMADSQYLYDASVTDLNTGESGKIESQMLDVLKHLPEHVKGYRIAGLPQTSLEP
eukprot:1098819-Rhodomonas_salina.1